MQIASSRREAKEHGIGFYIGKVCQTCSDNVRYTASGNCRKCHGSDKLKSYRNAHYARNKDAVRERNLMKLYGISVATYDEMYSKQTGLCAICGDYHKRLCVDHRHVPFKVRDLLCSRCNTAIGLLRERTDLAQSACAYLQRHNGSATPSDTPKAA